MSSSTNITNQKVQSGSVASRSRFRFLDEDGAVVRVDKVAKSSKVRSKSIATNASIPTSVRREGLVAVTSVTGESVLIEGHELKIAKGSHKAVKVVEDESRLVLPSSSKSRGAHGGVGKLKKEKYQGLLANMALEFYRILFTSEFGSLCGYPVVDCFPRMDVSVL
ncbi:hypothetical protein V6N12_064883 [Hibiscus sabdariffa]|uniref:Uncharacterized protein n=1 Tax=Hibiscus sabdariffa TaxID=183260 RepID=A0ABR2G791_9ROSI